MLALLLLPLLWAGSLQEEPRYQLRMPSSVSVQEGLCILVPCSFSYPRGGRRSSQPLYISWYREEYGVFYSPVATNNPNRNVKKETKDRFHLIGDMESGNCSLAIRGAKKKDAGRYFLYLDKETYAFTDQMLELKVTDLTEKPLIRTLEPLESGRPANLSCSLPGACLMRKGDFFWTGAVVSSMKHWMRSSSELSIIPRPQDHDTNLTCKASLSAQVTTETTVRLNVSYAPQNLNISLLFGNGTVVKILHNASSLQVLEGQALRFRCATQSNPPAQLSCWPESPSHNASLASSEGLLELPVVQREHDGEFTCAAQNSLGAIFMSLSLSVHYPPETPAPSCSWVAENLNCNCSSQGHPAPSLRWRLGAGLLEGNSSNASYAVTSSSWGSWANSSLTFHGELSTHLMFSCEVGNVHGTQRATVLLLWERPTQGTEFSPVLAALGGGAVTALLFLGGCLVAYCIMKACKWQIAKTEGPNDREAITDTVNWGSRQEPRTAVSRNQAISSSYTAGNVSSPREEQELYYASLSFQRVKSKEEATEYSEIRISK